MNPLDIFLPFQQALLWLITTLTNATLSYGLAIILFTIIIRTALAPLYVAQIRSSRKMMELSPRLKELQKKYGKDREALTRETMALYREHKHNPAIGCLLPLIQLPILWSLFLVLRNLSGGTAKLVADHIKNPQLYSAHFLWLDLGKPDAYHILPIVAGITQWIQQRMMLQPTSDPQQRQMNQIMQFLPIMIVAFAWAYPSGLAVYWVTSNIIMMVMQYLISGWGSLFTSPFSIPFPGDPGFRPPRGVPATVGNVIARPSPAPARPAGGFFARALAAAQPPEKPSQNQARGSGTADEKPSRSNGGPAGDTRERPPADDSVTQAARAGKMERYAARHGRGASRGRPSAKGAKK